MLSEENTTTTEAPAAHCCVAHPDAGGPCSEPFAVEVRELAYCERHGEEARLLAAEEERHEAETFFERFRNPYVSKLSAPVERVLVSLDIGPDVAAQYDDALARAYADAPEDVRERIVAWEQDEEEEFGFGFIYDRLLQSLWLISRLQLQRAVATPGGPPSRPYPSVERVDQEQGIWDLYLPEDLVRALDKQQAYSFHIEAEDRYIVIHFLDRS